MLTPTPVPKRYESIYEHIRQLWFGESTVTLGRELTGGHSDASVMIVDIAPQGLSSVSNHEILSGSYVLKLDSPQRRDSNTETEIQRHQTAYKWSPEFSNSHLMKLVHSIEIDGKLGFLYEIAGASMVTVAAADTVEAGSLYKSIRELSKSLLSGFNPTPKIASGMLPTRVLQDLVGYRLDPSKASNLHALITDFAGLQPTFSLREEVLINPLWLCSCEILNEEPQVIVLTGMLHGDLHLRNVLIDRLNLTGDGYWLIDFALSTEGPLGYDHAYLELSFLLKHLGHLGPERMLGVLRELDYPTDSPKANSVPLNDVGIINCVRGIRDEISRWQKLKQPRRLDVIDSQMYLSRVAAGINWANKPIGEPGQRHALIYSAWAARSYVKTFHRPLWTQILGHGNPKLSDESAPSSPSFDAQKEEETWSQGWERIGRLGTPGYKYILVAGALGTHDNNPSLGMVSWSAVFDFDPASAQSGLHFAASRVLSKSRAISQFGLEMRSVNFSLGTAWMMCYGWPHVSESIPQDFRQWRRQYVARIRELCEKVTSVTAPQRLHIIILPGGNLAGEVLQRTIEEFDEIFGDLGQITLVGSEKLTDESLLYLRINLAPRVFIRHLREVYGVSDTPDAVTIPGPDGQRIIPIEILRHIEQDIEVLHSAIITSFDPDSSPDAFWRGSPPTWQDIHACTDVIRSIHRDFISTVRDALEQSRNLTIELHHSPGAGGTTAAMRVAWELRTLFPVAFLRNDSRLLVDRIRDLFHIAQSPILLVIDGPTMTKSAREELYQSLSANHTRVVILHVMRTLSEDMGRRLKLHDPMSRSESKAFFDNFKTRLEIVRDHSKLTFLSQVTLSQDKSPLIKYRSPFFFGLITYGSNFISVSHYVSEYLSAMPANLRESMLFLALVSRFSQLDMTVSLMTALAGMNNNGDEAAFEAALKEAAALVVRRGSNLKLLHPIIADEVLRQLMGKRASQPWSADLAELATRFIDTLIRAVGVKSKLVNDILVGTFIFRDRWPGDGLHVQRFSEFIEAISDSQSQHRVLQHLTAVMPEEAHFWNHLGRHQIYRLAHDFETAERYLKKAVELSSDDSTHYHSLGMVRRLWILDKLQQMQQRKVKFHKTLSTETMLESVRDLADRAFEAFSQTRKLNPDDNHGYITQMQLSLEIIEALIHNAGATGIGRMEREGSNVNSWLREQIAVDEQLLAQVQKLRPESKPSRYETSCLSKLAKVWGDYTLVIKNWENIIDKDDDNIFIRRALASAYVASNKRNWNRIPADQLRRISDLMEINLREDPSNEGDLRAWFEANRRLSGFSYMEAISKLNGWANESESADAWYNLYILHFLLFRSGIELSEGEISNAIRHCKERAPVRRGYSYHWLGNEPKWCPIVHFGELGEWDDVHGFYRNSDLLARVRGTIKLINGPQSGLIRLGAHIGAFFVPGAQFFASHDINAEVEFFLGFSYDGFRAWSVTRTE